MQKFFIGITAMLFPLTMMSCGSNVELKTGVPTTRYIKGVDGGDTFTDKNEIIYRL